MEVPPPPIICDDDEVLSLMDASSLSNCTGLNRPLLPESHHTPIGTCSFTQSTFNAINVLIGVGILSLPFALKITGWAVGFALMTAFMALTNYTARLIARCLDYRRSPSPSVMNTGRDGNDKRDFGTFTTAYSSESLDGQSTAFNSGPSQSFLCDTESTSSAGVDWDQSTQYGELPAGQKGRPFSGYSQALAPPPPPPFKPMMTYSEIGMEAFHHKGRIFISILFTLELFAAAVALIILIADSLHSLFPQQGLVPLKLLAFLVVTPTMWLPNLKYLSYGSVLGIIAMANLLVVVLIDGLTTTEQPGSLLRPEQTNLWCRHLFKLPISFGLIMSGFAGHAVFPNIYREMKEPHRFTSLLNTSYIITFVVYSTMATAGYLMFGEFTLDEITKNLAAVPFYNAALNTLTIWLIAINPMTKYALTLRPISTNFELWFLAHTNQSSNPATTLALSESYPLRLQLSAGWLVHVPFRMIQIMFRTLLSSLVLVVSILFPGFERIISLLGSLFSFIVSVIFPIACYLKLFRPGMGVLERMILYTLLAASCAMALTGTIWALLPHDIIGIESRNIFQ